MQADQIKGNPFQTFVVVADELVLFDRQIGSYPEFSTRKNKPCGPGSGHNGTRRPDGRVLRRFVQSGRQGNHLSRHRHRMSGPDMLQRARQQTATGCEAVFSSGYWKLWKFDTQGRSLSKPESSGIASRNRKRDSQKPVRLFLDDKVEVVFKGPNVPQRHAIPSGRH